MLYNNFAKNFYANFEEVNYLHGTNFDSCAPTIDGSIDWVKVKYNLLSKFNFVEDYDGQLYEVLKKTCWASSDILVQDLGFVLISHIVGYMPDIVLPNSMFNGKRMTKQQEDILKLVLERLRKTCGNAYDADEFVDYKEKEIKKLKRRVSEIVTIHKQKESNV